ncbi:MAG TPA: c-type cytochrome [Kofleriaceae bacterium]|nr:c-type cytochrome [Kofleriaceae bacterium]
MRNILLIIGVCAAFGCGNKKKEAPEAEEGSSAAPKVVEVSPAAQQEAQQTFDTVCSVCHGKDGRGDGPGAAALNPKPRNYTDKAWQKSVSDEQIKNTILMGGAAVGKSPAMPAQPQLREKPEVVAGLVKIVRGFGEGTQAEPAAAPAPAPGSNQPAPAAGSSQGSAH